MRKSLQTLYTAARPFIAILLVLALALALSITLSSGDTPIASDSVEVIAIEVGDASYYGSELAGRHTASGEIFDPEKLTAAHPSLPMDTQLRVTNLRNDQVVTVRVNDRGPFTGGRVLDLSQRAAQEIGMMRTGYAPVKIEVIQLP